MVEKSLTWLKHEAVGLRAEMSTGVKERARVAGAVLGKHPEMAGDHRVRFGLLGGSIVDSNALLRAYIWHCVAIPIIASAFMVVHFWRVRKDGGISGPAPMMLESEIKEPRKL